MLRVLRGEGNQYKEQLYGIWDDDCPFEFNYKNFKDMQQISPSNVQQNFQLPDHESNYTIEKFPNSELIKIYVEPDAKLIQLHVKQALWQDYDYKIRFTLEYLVYIRENKTSLDAYFHTFKQNQGRHFYFTQAQYQQFWYKSNIFYLLILSYPEFKLRIYRVQNDLQLKLIYEIDQNHQMFYLFYWQSFTCSAFQHNLGFFANYSDYICLISKLSLKKLCVFKKHGFNRNYEIFDALHDEKELVVWKNFILLEVNNGKSTIMAQIQNGKFIRKIEGYNSSYCDQYQKRLFQHFLLICCQESKYCNSFDVYDFKKGRYVAEIFYQAYKILEPAEIRNDYLIIKNRGWNIKKKYQKN